MSSVSTNLLKKFNERFLSFFTMIRRLVPDVKELLLVEDGIDFCINRGNPEIPLTLF